MLKRYFHKENERGIKEKIYRQLHVGRLSLKRHAKGRPLYLFLQCNVYMCILCCFRVEEGDSLFFSSITILAARPFVCFPRFSFASLIFFFFFSCIYTYIYTYAHICLCSYTYTLLYTFSKIVGSLITLDTNTLCIRLWVSFS